MPATLLLALLVLTPGDDPEPARAVKPVATADWAKLDRSASLDATPLVLRSSKELVAAMPIQLTRSAAPEYVEKQVTATSADALGQKSLDWDKHMIVVLSGGKKATTGWKIEVESIAVKGDTMTVKWKLDGSKAKAEAISYPAVAVLVPTHKGKVKFEQTK